MVKTIERGQWSAKDISDLTDRFNKGDTIEQVARLLSRTESAVMLKAYVLGFRPNSQSVFERSGNRFA
jgi:hypothetical protein